MFKITGTVQNLLGKIRDAIGDHWEYLFPFMCDSVRFFNSFQSVFSISPHYVIISSISSIIVCACSCAPARVPESHLSCSLIPCVLVLPEFGQHSCLFLIHLSSTLFLSPVRPFACSSPACAPALFLTRLPITQFLCPLCPITICLLLPCGGFSIG